MRALLFTLLAATCGPLPAFAETLHSASGSSAATSESSENEQSPSAEQISQELKCAIIFSEDIPKDVLRIAEDFAGKFAEIWAELNKRGFPFPSATERMHFYSQILYESRNFFWQRERDPKKSKIKDAETWRGRGPIQLSHCANYAAFAYFMKNYHDGKNGRELFRYPSDLYTLEPVNSNPKKKKRVLNCPPPSVKDSIVMAAPDDALGNSPLASRFVPALSAIWWWEDRKLRSKEFREAVTDENENAVSTVTSFVKGSTVTASQRLDKFKVARKCVKK